MKKITFLLSLATLGLGLTSASAAVQGDEATVTLEAFTVSAERYTEGEKAIAASLAEFREQARATAKPVRTELPALHAVAGDAQPAAKQAVAAHTASHLPSGRS